MSHDEELWLTFAELKELKDIVCVFIDEGFTSPPYSAEMYSIIKKLGIKQEDVTQYNIQINP